MKAIIKIGIAITLLPALFLPSKAFAQSDSVKYTYRAMAMATPDSIMLRWAPVDYESWKRGLHCGYQVIRYTLFRDNQLLINKDRKDLTQNPLMAWPIEKWEILADSDNYAGVAAQAIYGDDFTPETENNSSVVSIFNKATEQQNRFAFSLFAADASVSTARGMALYFADHKIKKGEKYLYMIFPACNDTLATDTAYVYTGPDEYIPLIKPVITQVVAGSKTVTLQWKSPEGRWGYTSFEIQRSADQGKTFVPVNKTPLINTMPEKQLQDYNFYIDSLPNNRLTYYYRIRGLNPFGIKGPFTDTVPVQGLDQRSITPHIVSHITEKKGVVLVWEIDTLAEKQVNAFKVMRSPNSKTGWIAVSPKLTRTTRSFTDTKPLTTAYYKVSAWSTTGNSSPSFPVLVQLIDSIPPNPPTGLTGQIDTSGVVTVRWKANTEPDIYGYRVYRGNASFEEFSQLTIKPIHDTIFTDKISLKTLTKHIYYKIMATDKRQNFSKFSVILELKRPDIVPPTAPIILDMYSSVRGVTFAFAHSSSNDVVAEYLLRRQTSYLPWDTCANITKANSLFTDSLGVATKRYEYTLQSRDDAGLVSKTAQIVTGLKLALPPAKPLLKAEAKKSESHIELQWQLATVGRYQVYRACDKEKLSLYTTIDSLNNNFIDKNVKPGHTYRYQLKYLGKNGIAMGNQVEVKY